jgi:hypothetical protein
MKRLSFHLHGNQFEMNQNKYLLKELSQQKQHGLMLYKKQRLIVLQGFFGEHIQLMKDCNENFVSLLDERKIEFLQKDENIPEIELSCGLNLKIQ